MKESMLGRWMEALRFWLIEKLNFERKEVYYLSLALVCALLAVGLVFYKFSSLSEVRSHMQAQEAQKASKNIKTIEFITEKDVKILEF